MSSKSVIIIGGGPGGYAAALEAVRRNVSVILIEEQDIGGTCLNRGCIPSKFFLSKSKQFADALRLADVGIQVRLEKIRLRPLLEQKTNVVTTLRKRMEQAIKSASVEHLVGHAQFTSPTRVEIISPHHPTQTREADAIVLATGTTPIIPKTFPKEPCVFNSNSIFDLPYLPSHLVVVGGGYIGCELACAFQGLGSKVTLIEKEPRLLATQPEFEAAGTIFQRTFEKRGMTVWTRTEVQSVTPLGDQLLRLHCSNGEKVEANALLLALGRAPNLHLLELSKAGLTLTQDRLKVNAAMQTSVPSIYAIGDLVSPLPLAHVAAREGEIAVAHLQGENRSISYANIPRCIYTWPEAAAVGMTEEQAKQAGSDVRIDRYHLAASSKAMVEQETEGFWMILSDAKTHKILGGQIVGPHATELIHLIALSLRAGLTAHDIVETVFAHPTLAEGFQEAMARSLQTPKTLRALAMKKAKRTDECPASSLPPEYKRQIPAGPLFHHVQEVLEEKRLNTICVSGKCPNRGECFSRGSLAFMILGDICTRHCGFCAVKVGQPEGVDVHEPERLARAAAELNLRHVVITSVARDDLQDGGASIFAECIRQLQHHLPDGIIEVLTPDFNADTEALEKVLQAGPDIYNHNMETVERLTPKVRSRAQYRRSLAVLEYAKRATMTVEMKTKSGLMLGLGESRQEVSQTLRDLRAVGCDYLTIGQYLQPSTHHLTIQSFVPISDFQFWKEEAFHLGFERVASGPLVRSSYFADQLHSPDA